MLGGRDYTLKPQVMLGLGAETASHHAQYVSVAQYLIGLSTGSNSVQVLNPKP